MSLIGFKAQNHPQQQVVDNVDDRRTPPDLLAECAALACVERFDFDAASNDGNHIATAWSWCTPSRSGLTSDWVGNVWCNPPYSGIGAWVAKAHEESRKSHVLTIAMLLPANRTEQKWWQEYVEPGRRDRTLEVYFLANRRRFDRPGWTKPAKGDRPPFGLCLVVWPAA